MVVEELAIPKTIINSSGEGGIRTLGGPKPTTVFETVPFNHSGTSPEVSRVRYEMSRDLI